MSTSNDLLTIDEAADRIRMSTRHVRRLLAEGQLVYHRLGRAIRIYTTDLDAYIAAGRVESACDEAPAGATAGASD